MSSQITLTPESLNPLTPLPDPDLLNSLLLQRPEPPASPAGSDLNFNLNLNERAEPYAILVNCFIFLAHLFPYVLVVALAVWRS